MVIVKFNKEQESKSSFILANKNAKLSSLDSNDLRKLAVAWSYYSGKIEGNTYTYVETEALLIDNITSQKNYEDAKMLKNLHNTFTSVLQGIKLGSSFKIDQTTLFNLHSKLISDLVSDNEQGQIRTRPVRISGTNYIPPKEKSDIIKNLNQIFNEEEKIKTPLAKSIFLHCNLARTQPFIDGNKRTARLIESIVLMQNDIIPIYSTKDADIVTYRNGVISYYERSDYNHYINYFLDKHLARINEVSIEGEDFWKTI